MNKFVLYFSWALSLCLGACTSKSEVIVVLTSDVHGHINHGYARVSTFVDSLRAVENNVLLLDNGDYLQGTTAVYFSNLMDNSGAPNIMTTVFNKMNYSAIGVGNHDIEAGKNVFDRLYSSVQCPVVCANVTYISTGEPYFQPYIVKEAGGCKVAILGLTTPYVSTWLSERLRPGLAFEPIGESASYWVERIHRKVHPDVLICLIHSGYKGGATGFLGEENDVENLALTVPGIDLICYGHDHKPYTGVVLSEGGKEVQVMNPGANGKYVAVAVISNGGHKNRTIVPRLEKVSQLPADSLFMQAVMPFMDRVADYADTPIAVLKNDIRSDDVFKGPCGWVDEVHRAQLDLAGLGSDLLADVSFAASLASGQELLAGPLLLKDFFTWFPFENSLCLVQMTGQEIKDYLEYSYRSEEDEIFNFDTAAGIIYKVDSTATYGHRIEIVSMADGQKFDFAKKYNVAMNSYRSMGGGGHLIEGLGWTSAQLTQRRVWEGKMDIRRLIMDWEGSRTPFEALPLNQWSYK